jgi:hypothetical protein
MNAEQQKRARELRDLGARLDDEIVEQAGVQLCPISIRPITQACRLYEVHDLPEGGTGFEARVRLTVSESSSILKFQTVRILLPWTQVSLLPKPRKIDGGCYRSFDGRRHPIDVHDVLNHRIRRGQRMFPGEEVEGLILGFGLDSIPAEYLPEYLRGQKVPATLWVEATPRYVGKFSLMMMVFRNKEATSPNHLPLKRESLFARRDPLVPGE